MLNDVRSTRKGSFNKMNTVVSKSQSRKNSA